MKERVFKQWKKRISLVLSIALLLGACLTVPFVTKAAERPAGETYLDSDTGVKYVAYDKADCTIAQAPVYSGADEGYGYLFGGWFKTQDGKYDPIKNADDKAAVGSTIYAKFVPAYVLGIKCQNANGTKATSSTATLRIVSSIDSKNYQKVGFDLIKIIKNNDGSFASQSTIGINEIKETTTTYAKLRVYKDDVNYTDCAGTDIFGPASKYLTTWKVNNIPNGNFGSIIGIRPYWVTLDGAKVYGLTKYAHVEDGYLNYINVPVNLKNSKDVAAGMLDVNYGSGLNFVDAECGQVFEEMEWKDNGAGKVRCVGNVSNISQNVASDNLYINLRFTGTPSSLDFTVTGENFSNIAEELLEEAAYNVWNVKAGIVH